MAFFTGRFTRGDDADGFFMADHMYYKEKPFAFGISDGGLAGFGRVAGVHYLDEGVKEHSQAAWKETPCFRTFTSAFSESHSNATPCGSH